MDIILPQNFKCVTPEEAFELKFDPSNPTAYFCIDALYVGLASDEELVSKVFVQHTFKYWFNQFEFPCNPVATYFDMHQPILNLAEHDRLVEAGVNVVSHSPPMSGLFRLTSDSIFGLPDRLSDICIGATLINRLMRIPNKKYAQHVALTNRLSEALRSFCRELQLSLVPLPSTPLYRSDELVIDVAGEIHLAISPSVVMHYKPRTNALWRTGPALLENIIGSDNFVSAPDEEDSTHD
jgi:hypothetical protein